MTEISSEDEFSKLLLLLQAVYKLNAIAKKKNLFTMLKI
jgi:hypothetical protein